MRELSEFLDKKRSLGDTLLEIMLKETNGGKTLFQCIQTYGYRHASPSKLKCFDFLMYVLDNCQELRQTAHLLAIKPEQQCCGSDYGFWEVPKLWKTMWETTVVDKALLYIDHRALLEFRVWTGLEKTNADVVTVIANMILPKCPARSEALPKEEDGNVVVTFKGSFGLRIEKSENGKVFVSGFVGRNYNRQVKKGMYILSLNGVPVPKIENIDEMVDLISEAKSKGPVTVVFSPTP